VLRRPIETTAFTRHWFELRAESVRRNAYFLASNCVVGTALLHILRLRFEAALAAGRRCSGLAGYVFDIVYEIGEGLIEVLVAIAL